MIMKKIMLSLPEKMVQVLEKERKERYLETIPETVRVILSDYLRNRWLKYKYDYNFVIINHRITF